MSGKFLDGLIRALKLHNLQMVQQVLTESQAHLQTLLSLHSLSELSTFSGRIHEICTSYIKEADASKDISLWLMTLIDLQNNEVIKIKDDEVAGAYAAKMARNRSFNNAHYFLVDFTNHSRVQCCRDILSEEDLSIGYHALLSSEQKDLIMEMVNALTSFNLSNQDPPEHWIPFLQNINELHPEWTLGTWAGADLAICLKKHNLNNWMETHLDSIMRNPAVEDRGHFLKMQALGYNLNSVQRREIFRQALNALGIEPKANNKELREGAATVIEAIMVLDFKNKGDYAYSAEASNSSILMRSKARAASWIWESADDQEREALLVLLNMDFNTYDITLRNKAYFDGELYRHLELGLVDALEDDLGL